MNVGKIGPNVEVKIMEDGEVWVRGDAMMSGYYLRPDDEAFGNADGKRWVMTGDLGFVHEGCLYIKGRKKDVIILNGRNIVSTDVEWVLQEKFPELRPGNIAAVPFYENEEEKLGIVAELQDHLVAPSRKAMRRAMYEAMEVPLWILFVKKDVAEDQQWEVAALQVPRVFRVKNLIIIIIQLLFFCNTIEGSEEPIILHHQDTVVGTEDDDVRWCLRRDQYHVRPPKHTQYYKRNNEQGTKRLVDAAVTLLQPWDMFECVCDRQKSGGEFADSTHVDKIVVSGSFRQWSKGQGWS